MQLSYSTFQAKIRNVRSQKRAFRPVYCCVVLSIHRFTCTSNWYVSLCMNVPSQREILLLQLKIPVILHLIEFEIFMWRPLKIAFPGFQFSTFSVGANCAKKPLEARAFGAPSISLLRNIRISTNKTPLKPQLRA